MCSSKHLRIFIMGFSGWATIKIYPQKEARINHDCAGLDVHIHVHIQHFVVGAVKTTSSAIYTMKTRHFLSQVLCKLKLHSDELALS